MPPSQPPDDRRTNVPFDPYHFEKQAHQGRRHSIADTFRQIYDANHWTGDGPASGAGATAQQTRHLHTALPALCRDLGVATLLDAPCGDFGWMQAIDLPVNTYIGADIVPALVARNQAAHGRPGRRFMTLDLTHDPFPDADLLLCRDALVHLSFDDIARVLDNVRRSPIPYLLTTTFTGCTTNEDIVTGDWRVLNLERPPFNLPPPLRLINEGCTEGEGLFGDKCLGLWATHTLPGGLRL